MSREIKFKGKLIHNNEWIISNGFIKHNDGTIVVISKHNDENVETSPIHAETLCESAGLKDKNGVDIYEGDVISIHQFLFDGNEIEKEWKCSVEYITEHNASGFGVKVISGEFALEHTGYKNYKEMPPFTFSSIYGLHEESFEVIGNIHESPELLKETNK